MSQSPGTFPEVLGEDSVLAAFRGIDQIGNLATVAADTTISASDEYWQWCNQACKSS